MTAVRPYLLLGDRDRECLHSALEAALASWRTRWLARDVPVPVLSWVAAGAGDWISADAGHGRIAAVGCTPAWKVAISQLVVGAGQRASDAKSELACAISESMLKALVQAVLGETGELRWSNSAPPADLEPASGSACVGCAFGDSAPALFIVVWPGWVEANLSSVQNPYAPRAQLEPALPAIELKPVSVVAVLGTAELEIDDLSTLAVGDVLLLDRQLDQALELRLEDGTAFAVAELGAVKGKKAVQLMAHQSA